MRRILALVIAVIVTNLLTLAAVYAFGMEKDVYCPVRWIPPATFDNTISLSPERVLNCRRAAAQTLLCDSRTDRPLE